MGALSPTKVRINELHTPQISDTKSYTTQLLKDCSFDSPLECWNSTGSL